MLNIKPVMRFIRISNARNSVNFCTIFPCAKDSSWTRRKINLRSDELNGGPFSRRLIFCWIDIINSIYSLNLCWEIRIDPDLTILIYFIHMLYYDLLNTPSACGGVKQAEEGFGGKRRVPPSKIRLLSVLIPRPLAAGRFIEKTGRIYPHELKAASDI